MTHPLNYVLARPQHEIVERRVELREIGPRGFVVGLDLGKSQDFTALCVDELIAFDRVVLERSKFAPTVSETGRRRVMRHRIRNLHRYRRGTPYPEIGRDVASVMRQLPIMHRKPELVVDRTGVGAPVVDGLREMDLHPTSIGITGGTVINEVSSTEINVPKLLLASTIDACLSEDRLAITDEADASDALKAELAGFHARVRPTGSVALEAWREGTHDDLVLALALAVWRGENPSKSFAPHVVRFNLFDRGGGTW